METEDLNFAYFLLNEFVDSIGKEEIERNYLLELQEWFLKHIHTPTETRTVKVKAVQQCVFKGKLSCLESEDQYGFFKSQADVRPSSCTWINKDDAEHLYNIFTTKEYPFD